MVLTPGAHFAGFVIEGVLGSGGMGSVYVALQPQLHRRIALKLLSEQLSADDGFKQRFMREAILGARLAHPNVVTIYDQGVTDRQLWIAMQLVDGRDAAELLRESGRGLAPDRVATLLGQIGSALDHAHALGMVHRDVKPANILIRDTDGAAILTDFGIARASDLTRLTATDARLLSIAYASPEQLDGGVVDSRSDIYSLGASVFELLSARPPFVRDTPSAVMFAHLAHDVPDVSRLSSGIPPAIDGVVRKAMAKRPEDRYQSAGELATQFVRALAPVRPTIVAAPQRNIGSPQPEPTPTVSAAVPAHVPPPKRRARVVVPAVAVCAAVLAAIIGLIVWNARDSDDGTDRSAAGTTESAGTSAVQGDPSIMPVARVDAAGRQLPALDPSEAADPAGEGTARCTGVSIAMLGALTGSDAALGFNVVGGVELAVDEHNKANPGCQVSLKQFDTEGDPRKATQVAPGIVGDGSIIGLVGPTFSGETAATGAVFNDGGLAAVTASATNATLAQNGWRTFFRGLASDPVQGPAVAGYLTEVLGYRKVCVIADDTAYGEGLGAEVAAALGDAASTDCAGKVVGTDRDFGAVVAKVKAADPDAVFYAGYTAAAALLAAQLGDAGVGATFVSGDGANDPAFVEQAGGRAAGALLSCACGPAPERFAQAYASLNGRAPGVYSVEAYDVATILLKGIDAGRVTRADLLEFVRTYNGQGLARRYQWTSDGELLAPTIWMYRVQ